jgi:hypothetical protein
VKIRPIYSLHDLHSRPNDLLQGLGVSRGCRSDSTFRGEHRDHLIIIGEYPTMGYSLRYRGSRGDDSRAWADMDPISYDQVLLQYLGILHQKLLAGAPPYHIMPSARLWAAHLPQQNDLPLD